VRYTPTNRKLHEKLEIIDPLLCRCNANNEVSIIRPNHATATRTRKSQDKWIEISQRHIEGKSLRQLAKMYDVSHEAIRQIVKR
jgi:hypothetical protein